LQGSQPRITDAGWISGMPPIRRDGGQAEWLSGVAMSLFQDAWPSPLAGGLGVEKFAVRGEIFATPVFQPIRRVRHNSSLARRLPQTATFLASRHSGCVRGSVRRSDWQANALGAERQAPAYIDRRQGRKGR